MVAKRGDCPRAACGENMAPMKRGLKVAILGTRGIPARYGGFETFAEELSQRLVSRGHGVTVYGRRGFFERGGGPDEYKGVGIRRAPTVRHKYLETPVSALFSILDVAARGGVDGVLLCNGANSPFAFILRLRGIPVFINVDGIERKRGKWNVLGRLWYRLGERCSVWFASRVVADAEAIAGYYLDRYGCRAEVIAYGADPRRAPSGEVLARFGLSSM